MTITIGVILSCGTLLAQGKEMALFLLIGPSNMAGRGAIKEPGAAVGKNVWMLNKVDEWVTANA